MCLKIFFLVVATLILRENLPNHFCYFNVRPIQGRLRIKSLGNSALGDQDVYPQRSLSLIRR